MSNETITPQYYFASPIYVHSKKEWVKPLIKATDFHIKESKKTLYLFFFMSLQFFCKFCFESFENILYDFEF